MEGKNQVAHFIKTNLSVIVVAIISIFYIFWGSVELQFKNLNWWELICFIATTLVFGISITNLIGESGFAAGKENEKYIATRSLLISWCNALISLKDEAIAYANTEIDKEILDERRTILHRAGIPYHDIFNDNGKVIISREFLKEKGKYTRKQKMSIKQAIRLKKYGFTLFAYSPTKIVGRKREQSEIEFRSRSLGKDFVVRIFLAIISGSIMFSFGGFDLAAIIYAAFQMIMWVASGVMKRQSNYNFIVITLRDTDLDRIGYLKSFAGYKGLKEKWVDNELVIDIPTQNIDNVDSHLTP